VKYNPVKREYKSCLILILLLILVTVEQPFAQVTDGIKPKIEWEKVILKNYATFKSLKDLDWGSAFLIKYNSGILAVTARDFFRSTLTHGQILSIRDFEKELLGWSMYLPDEPSKYIIMDTLALRDKSEKSFSIFLYSKPILIFALKNIHRRMIPLEPDVSRIRNKDTLFLVGYDQHNQLKIARGIVETALHEKYADDDIRIKTDEFLNYGDFVGSPVINREGKAVGVFNRAYRLKIDKRGRIISEKKEVGDSHFEYFINGTSMRSMLGKDYISNGGKPALNTDIPR